MNLLRQQKRNGAALVIVLAFVVLLLVLALSYFSRTVTDRQVAQSSFRQTNADQLALSAADIIVADLNQEIVNGSTASTVNNYTIYTPTSNANMIPMRSGNPSGSPDPIPNLIRRSVRSDPIAAPGVASRASAVNSNTNVSVNGRSISPARWNKHYLVPRLNASSTAIDTTPVGSFVAPDWVFMTSTGPTVLAAPSASVIGRYAYAIYDEGGLLDVNVAAFPYASPTPAPPLLPPPQPIYAPSPPYAQGSYPAGYTAATYTAQKIGRKGTSAFADLSVLPASGSTFFPPAQINNLVGWRNFASAQPGANFAAGFTFDRPAATRYYSIALSNLASFLQTSGAVWNNATDQEFVSRQDLLALGTTIGFSQNLLQYLGTFSREYNRPSWKPATTSAINPDLSGVTVTSAFTRLDGTPASQGEPLLKNRFPLRRLSWLTYKGPSATRTPFPPASPTLPATDPNYDMWQLLYIYGVPQSYLMQGTAANIKASFGLVWDTRTTTSIVGSQWFYTSPSSSNSGGTFSGTSGSTATVVKTLTTVQSEAREPDFFEILKATILNGSVGLGSNNTANTFVVADRKYWDTTNGKSADYQIMQVGANIIDAWDTDDIPTFISFGSDPTSSPANQPYVLAGIENLPYLNKLVFKPYWKTNVTPNTFDAWLLPSLWNPHQNAPGTGNVRIAMTAGTMTASIKSTTGTTLTSSSIPWNPGGNPNQYMTIDASGFGSSPSAPSAAPVNTGSGSSISQSTDPSPGGYYGFHFTFGPPGTITPANSSNAYPDFGTGCDFQMQVQVGTAWRAYQTWKGCAQPATRLTCQSPSSWTVNTLQDPEFVSIDPRTVRFGIWGNDAKDSGNTNDYTTGALLTLDENNGGTSPELIFSLLPQGSHFVTTDTKKSGYLYAVNQSANVDYYSDLDGIVRSGDWPTGNGSTNGTTIMYPADSADRPQILSSPFQSVAELGQIFRDQPWKTLAFTIANSGDAGLLDAFTLQDVSITGTAPSSQYVWMTAGRTSLNTRQAPVLTAIMSQVSKAIAGTGVIPTNSTDTTVSSISNALVGLTTATPMISKAELVTRLAANASVTGLGNKEAREAVMRALSDAGQTRTWNLMIDVIAQSGRYKPNPTSLQNDFIAEGEQRYWVHVAIDRFTGQVIDRQVEPVNQ